MPIIIREFLFQFVRKAFVKEAGHFRFWIFGLAIVLGASGLIYYQIVDFLDPSMNLVRYTWNEYLWGDPAENFKVKNPDFGDLKSYTFYAGKPGGYYNMIGSCLDSAWTRKDSGDLTMVPHGGSTKIARAVYTNQRALGIVQEDVLRDLDLTSDKIQIVAPLYDELVHVLYRRDSFSYGRTEMHPLLHPEHSGDWGLEFAQAVTRIQSTPAPGFPLGYYLLHFSNVFPKSYVAADIDSTVTLLNADSGGETRLDLAVVIAGAPLQELERLDFELIGLMPVTPDLTRLINPTMNIELRPSGFAGVYDRLQPHRDGSDIPTLASRAMLIASRDVPSWIIRDIGALLGEMKVLATVSRDPEQILDDHHIARIKDFGRNLDPLYLFPDSKYPFTDSIRKEYPGMLEQMVPMLLLFLIVVFLCARTSYNVLTFAISNYKHAKYSRQINEVYKKLPKNAQLNGEDSVEPVPVIDANHEFRINELIKGISALLARAEEIRDDFVSGGIQVGHQSNLIETLYGVKGIFQRQLAQRINEALLHGFPVSRERIRRLYTAGYIELPAYCELCELADRVAELRPLDSLVDRKTESATQEPEPEAEEVPEPQK